MPVPRNTPEEKRRVRTGCVVCRQRRRKCDEKKPQCSSCESRRVACKYAIGQDANSGSYAKITFVENKASSAKSTIRQQKCMTVSPAVSSLNEPNISAPRTRVWELPNPRPIYHHKTPHSNWESYFRVNSLDPQQRHIALLRQFRYRTGPWLEAGDPGGSFGVAVLQMAQEVKPLQVLIAELASCHLLNPFDSSALREAQSQLLNAPPEAMLIGDAIIGLVQNLFSRPSVWKELHSQTVQDLCSSESSVYNMEEPLQTLARQHSKIDLAASILSAALPTTKPSFYLPQGLPTDANGSSLYPAYNWALYHLTACLHFIFNTSMPSRAAIFAGPGSPEGLAASSVNTNWHTLWLGCQSWYDSRPVEMQPLVDVGSIERSQIDPRSLASFPLSLYTNATAVQATIFYHITALFLLEHKPRLLSVPARRHHFMSRSWHVRAIAGIAASNAFPEQWDPIIIASLLNIARDITHDAQQEAIMQCFREISVHTSIPLEDELERLRSCWATACLVEGSESR